MKKYYIELNGKYVKEYSSFKRAVSQYLIYGANPDNCVRIWCNGDIVMEKEV